jgi:hypothetical protein
MIRALEEKEEIVGSPQEFLENVPVILQMFGEIHMGDKYEAGQAGAMGPNAHAHDMTFSQIWQQSKGEIDLNQLADELKSLRKALMPDATSAEKVLEVGLIAQAETEAKQGNGSKVLEYLSKVGKWGVGVAEKIGVNVATAAIKTSMGL